jgi:AcrR family transcriptional regulator
MKRVVRNPADRRASIIEAARDLFQTKEYDKATMKDVMDALDIAKGTIYHYFPSKEALLEAVIEDIVDENMSHMESIVQAASGNALEKMEQLVSAGDISAENEDLLDKLHQPGNSAMHSLILASAITKQAKLYEQLIKQGCREGLFDVENPLECAELFLAGIQFLTDRGIYPWSSEDIQRRAKAFPKIIERLLSAPPGSFDFMLQKIDTTTKKG